MGLTSEIRAAGGVVVRPGEGGESSVLVVHRPSYDDWTLPKGKNEPDETDEACAVREVEEETGLRCVLGPRVAEVGYRDHKDRSKTVVYFLMTPIGGAFLPNDEVDEVRWLGLEPATQLLSYSRDADIVRCALGETTTTQL